MTHHDINQLHLRNPRWWSIFFAVTEPQEGPLMTRIRSRDYRRNETPFSQLQLQLEAELTIAEMDGSLAREVGMVGRRVHQPGRRYFAERAADPASIFHVWPMSACPAPRPSPQQDKPSVRRQSPSAHHPMPRRRRSA